MALALVAVLGAVVGPPSLQDGSDAMADGVNVTQIVPKTIAGTLLTSVAVNVTVPGLMFLLVTVKYTFPLGSADPVW